MSQEDRVTMIKTLREEALKETDQLATKQRFALFSSPPPLGLGDDTYDKKERPKRDENGKVVTQPTNVKIAAPKSGKIKSSYFSQMGFATLGNLYVDPERQNRLYELEKLKKIKNDAKFKPASGYKEMQLLINKLSSIRISAPYEHQSDIDPKQPKKNYRDPDGKVQTAPKNVTTNPYMKKLFVPPAFMKDEYSRARDADIKLLKESQAMMKEKPPFKTTVAGGENFNNDKKSFGLDGQQTPKKPPHETQLNIMKHEMPFKPSNPNKRGVLGTLGPFPEYKGDPLKPLTRKDLVKTKDPFKPNHGGHLTRPTPTISCYPQNIRREMAAKIL